MVVLPFGSIWLSSNLFAEGFILGTISSGSLHVPLSSKRSAQQYKTIGVIAGGVWRQARLRSVKEECHSLCEDNQQECLANAAYDFESQSTLTIKDAIVYAGQNGPRGPIRAIEMNISTIGPMALVDHWALSEPKVGICLGYHEGEQLPISSVTAGWAHALGSKFYLLVPSLPPISQIPEEQLRSCNSFVGGGFASLGCTLSSGNMMATNAWLYYKDRFVLLYGCDDCDTPALRVTGQFEFQGTTHFIITDSHAGVWILKQQGDAFEIVTPGSYRPPVCQ